jgi:hypothetical protein
MKRWALLVVGLYGLILAALSLPVIIAAFAPASLPDIAKVVASWEFYAYTGIWAGVMMLTQTALLVVPVRVAAARPVKKRHVFWLILAAVVAMLLLLGAMIVAAQEHIANTEGLPPLAGWLGFAVIAAAWLAWSLLFGLFSPRKEPPNAVTRVVRILLAGSILELLVAVPTHVIARSRNYCCAGFGTFCGLAVGLSVLLFAFGPGVFALFVRRWQAIRPPRQ